MAVTKTLMKGIASQGLAPSEVLGRVNIELCRENETMMFCTVFCGLLNIKTGELLYANAGHNPPLIVRSGREPELLTQAKGVMMGIREDTTYNMGKYAMERGDTLILYTDGVTEAMDRDKSLFATDRLLTIAIQNKDLPLEDLASHIIKSVKDFAGGEPQSDDITILAVRFTGGG
jgi:sigma-B regulation protein RsbU (phosphoserine phosphatase)